MPITKTPLRYPGGKSKLYNYMSEILKRNGLTSCVYVEPFAGGAGLALSLLFNNIVEEIVINDLDLSVYSFWDCVLNYTDKFIEEINKIPVTITEWKKQREIQKYPDNYSKFDLGLSTFYLNRVNRSGILKGGVIGGVKQDGKYKMDCRFNKKDLIDKISRIASKRKKIKLFNMDVKYFIPEVIDDLPANAFIYFDPPYIAQGGNLYCNYFNRQDHKDLSNLIKDVRLPWVLTYDTEPVIYNLYEGYQINTINLRYSAACKRVGTELVIFSHYLKF